MAEPHLHHHRHGDFLEPDDDAGTREELVDLAHRLERERPVPPLAFRAELRRLFVGSAAESPRRVRLLIAAYAGSGLVLFAVAVFGAAGAGPLAAG